MYKGKDIKMLNKLEMQQQKTNLQADNKLAKEYQGDIDSINQYYQNKYLTNHEQ